MSKTTAPQSWDRFKNVIRRLRDTHILEGQDGLIKIMEEKYGFKATYVIECPVDPIWTSLTEPGKENRNTRKSSKNGAFRKDEKKTTTRF